MSLQLKYTAEMSQHQLDTTFIARTKIENIVKSKYYNNALINYPYHFSCNERWAYVYNKQLQQLQHLKQLRRNNRTNLNDNGQGIVIKDCITVQHITKQRNQYYQHSSSILDKKVWVIDKSSMHVINDYLTQKQKQCLKQVYTQFQKCFKSNTHQESMQNQHKHNLPVKQGNTKQQNVVFIGRINKPYKCIQLKDKRISSKHLVIQKQEIQPKTNATNATETYESENRTTSSMQKSQGQSPVIQDLQNKVYTILLCYKKCRQLKHGSKFGMLMGKFDRFLIDKIVQYIGRKNNLFKYYMYDNGSSNGTKCYFPNQYDFTQTDAQNKGVRDNKKQVKIRLRQNIKYIVSQKQQVSIELAYTYNLAKSRKQKKSPTSLQCPSTQTQIQMEGQEHIQQLERILNNCKLKYRCEVKGRKLQLESEFMQDGRVNQDEIALENLKMSIAVLKCAKGQKLVVLYSSCKYIIYSQSYQVSIQQYQQSLFLGEQTLQANSDKEKNRIVQAKLQYCGKCKCWKLNQPRNQVYYKLIPQRRYELERQNYVQLGGPTNRYVIYLELTQQN